MPRLPSPFNKHGGPTATSIPMPAAASRRGGPGQLLPPGGGGLQQPGGGPLKSVSASSSRSTSPSATAHSFIPTPRAGGRSSLNEKHLVSNSVRSSTPSSSGSRSSLRTPAGNVGSPYTSTPTNQTPTSKNAMLDKLKIFNSKEKIDRVKGGNAGVSKRTSSSSGFSSARSEQSDSSTSLCSDANPKLCPSAAPNDIVVSSNQTSGDGSSPKSLARGLRNKLGKGTSVTKESKQNSPKTSRRNEPNRPSPKLSHKSGGNTGREHRDRVEGDKGRGVCESEPKVLRTEGDEFLYTPALEMDNPIKQSKISNIHSKSEPMTKSKRSGEVATSPVSRGPVAIPGSGSSIPKPMAAVKGTSKPSKEERQSPSPIKPSPPKPTVGDPLPLPKKQLGWDDTGSSISVALVSPMPNMASSESGSKMSESSNSNSNSTGQSNSSDSSVIYRPSSESGSEIGKTPPKKIETTFDNSDKVITQETTQVPSRETAFGEEEDSVMNVKPMQPLLRGYTGGLALGRALGPSMHHVSRLGLQGDSGMKCLNYPQDMGMSVDIKRGIGDGDYSDVEVAAGLPAGSSDSTSL